MDILLPYTYKIPWFSGTAPSGIHCVPTDQSSCLLYTSTTFRMKDQARKINEAEKFLAEAEKEKLRANLLRAVSPDLRTPLTSKMCIRDSSCATLGFSAIYKDLFIGTTLSHSLPCAIVTYLCYNVHDIGNLHLVPTPLFWGVFSWRLQVLLLNIIRFIKGINFILTAGGR